MSERVVKSGGRECDGVDIIQARTKPASVTEASLGPWGLGDIHKGLADATCMRNKI